MNILLGVTGSIAAYKAAECARLFIKSGHQVKVVMTENAKQFITPMTFSAITHHPVLSDTFDPNHDPMMHIELAKWADHIVVAPASASFIARLLHGFADDLLSTLCLASKAPISVAPAMNAQMWHNPITQKNIARLKEYNFNLINPGSGEQACGDYGLGRMAEPDEIAQRFTLPRESKLLASKKILITAGPTREALDPVRFLSNYSSGKMGYALAKIATELGATVTLISGSTALPKPCGVEYIPITSAIDMHDAVMDRITNADIFIATAAVADYRPQKIAKEKIKKQHDEMMISLTKNPDILMTVGEMPNKPYTIGFAAETSNILEHAIEKSRRKHCDLMIVNQIHSSGYPFNADHNDVHIIQNDNVIEQLSNKTKPEIAAQILQIAHAAIK